MAANIPAISQEDINANKGMAALSYLGFLFLIPLLAKKDSAYCRFHVNQGLLLFIIEFVGAIVLNILTVFVGFFGIISMLFNIACLVFAIIGIVNAATGKVKGLPLLEGVTLLK